MFSDELSISIIIPTRERCEYLKHTLQTCVDIPYKSLEIVILDNASRDETGKVVLSFMDDRIRYYRSETLLSMRNNWERGISLSSGSILCFIGDDDALFPDSIDRVLTYFKNNTVDAVMSSQARYYWPDTPTLRSNCGLLPIKTGSCVNNSRVELFSLLNTGRYQRLPCAYYGFVKRGVYNSVIKKQGRFFVSNMTDVYSAVALSAQNIQYLFSEIPLSIAGVSAKSNGGRADSKSARSLYLEEWKREDDIGFLPGYDGWKTIRSVIVEQGIHYTKSNAHTKLSDLFDMRSVGKCLEIESAIRYKAKEGLESIALLYKTAGIHFPGVRPLTAKILSAKVANFITHLTTFGSSIPIDFNNSDVGNIEEAKEVMVKLLRREHSVHTGFIKRILAGLKFL